jgi:hypothetical protein
MRTYERVELSVHFICFVKVSRLIKNIRYSHGDVIEQFRYEMHTSI